MIWPQRWLDFRCPRGHPAWLCLRAQAAPRPARAAMRPRPHRSVIERVTASRDRGCRTARSSTRGGAIHQVLAHGITQGLIAINVTASAKAPQKQHSDSRPWDRLEPAELITFRAVVDQDEWAAAWRLTMCGLRRSEVLGLTGTESTLSAERSSSRPVGSCSMVAGPTTPQVRGLTADLAGREIQPGTGWHSCARSGLVRPRTGSSWALLCTRDQSGARRRAGGTCQARGVFGPLLGVVPYG
jgi:hypothetical protein